jgi:hypothetical protein
MSMSWQFIEKTFAYDGTQLRSLFSYLEFGLRGDSVVSWIGPCQIDFKHMVDGEDLREQSPIQGAKMVHFIVELFGKDLCTAVSVQRLLASIVKDSLNYSGLTRSGDDIYWDDRKLSISIATVSPVSALIHFAVNVTNEGTPVKTLSLEDLKVSPQTFATEVMKKISMEWEGIVFATQKVKWVQ